MGTEIRGLQVALLHLIGPDEDRGTAYAGWLIQFGGWQGAESLWRVVQFAGEDASARIVTVSWEQLAAQSALFRDMSSRDLEVTGRLDTSDTWQSVALRISVDGAPARRLDVHSRCSGLEGADAPLLERCLDFLELRAGVRRPRTAGRSD